ncbi:ExeM/NucH family extracellular endonuclease [Microbulbifer sp. MLAF003]|uniref:ExeM/NucH family extracellular endonuclease n=1 Tax=Microbulbifer sp. MLAF003 TaxID=3032582 RepID=UPI0024ACF0B3|nr:ExeM/NucH family extracellular endonuclease [Microbulbifer sp. MLAF003]WHI52074.1 ExeM/NucH family extracellular endonuclease [Microbulbifer sp. MLAF003]
MKEFGLAALAALGLPLMAEEVQANDLIISEYIEGSGNNKALEIYNGTGAAVDLGNYSIQLFFNGSDSAAVNITLSGTLGDDEVFVLAHGSSDAAMLDVADQIYSGGLFNGDDAVALAGPNGFVDVIGQIGTDPGSQWGNSSVGTQNQTLIRNLDVVSGRTDGNSAFNPAQEWSSVGQNNFGHLGWHIEGDTGGGDGSGGIELGACGDTATLISQIQGEGFASSLEGERHEIEAVVVGNFQDSNTGLAGFFLQEEDSDQDGRDSTSEGLFIHDNAFGVDVQVGDLVRVGGIVDEFYDFTELNQVDGVSVCGSGYEVTAANVQMPFNSAQEQEQLEGMLVKFPQNLTVNGHYNLGRYGEIVLSSGRLYIPTHNNVPGSAAIAQAAANELNQIILDDGSTVQNPEEMPYPAPGLSAYNTLRSGDTLEELTGVMAYGFGAYRVHPVEVPQFSSVNLRDEAPVLPGDGSLRIASFNVLNYFNGDGSGSGFPTARGADTPEEFERQRDKIISAILRMDADVIGLMEIENDGYGSDSAIQDLVNGLNSADSGQSYQFVNPDLPQLGDDEIAVGMIYRSDRVMPIGSAATLQDYPFDDGNRQPLLQAFAEVSSGESLVVVVNHFKSKGSCPSDGSLNSDQGDGQGCWNSLRTLAADTLAGWIDRDPAGTGIDRVLVLGDLNSYAMENPITALKGAGYTDLLEWYGAGEAYSYVYDGQSGYLDHALASASLAPLVTATVDWHINADEPRALDYNTEYKSVEQQENLYSAGPYRASDHDPLIVELDLGADNLVPTAEFSWASEGLIFHFIDNSSDEDGNLVSWSWDFGDGARSTEQNPSHSFDIPGSYLVRLQVKDDRGAISTIEKIIEVKDDVASLQANFKLHRFFRWVWVEDRSQYNGDNKLQYQWNFGDGVQRSGRWALHRYSQTGNYEITLTVSDGDGAEDSASREVKISWPR